MIFLGMWVAGMVLQKRILRNSTKNINEDWNTLLFLAAFEITVEFFAIAIAKEVAK